MGRRVSLHQEDILVREREYGRRYIKLQQNEFLAQCRTNQRMKKLHRAITGKFDGDGKKRVTEVDLKELAKRTMDDLEGDFDAILDERQKRFRELTEEREASLERRREHCERSRDDVVLAQRTLQERLQRNGPAMRSATVQTDPVALRLSPDSQCPPASHDAVDDAIRAS